MINPNTEEAVNFLNRFIGNEIIVVTSIVPDGRTDTRSFGPDEKEKLKKHIEKLQGKRNIYFQVNLTHGRVSKKTKKDDIKSFACLHVDIDPREGHSMEDERKRILEMILNAPIKPTLIIDSGGGYQAFWKLKKPVAVNGNIAELENYNKVVEGFFGGDSCHNIDRIMRLPGTINIPNKKKRDKGRTETLAKLIYFGEEVYDLSSFSQFNPLPEKFLNHLENDQDVRRRWEGSSDGLNDTSRSGFDMSMTSLLKRRGYSREEVTLILQYFPYGKAREENDRYVERMFDRVEMDHNTIAPYEFTDRGIIWNKPSKDGFIPTFLTNFTAQITKDIRRDDGAEVVRFYEMKANVKGRKTTFKVSADEFPSLHWIGKNLGAGAVLEPGSTIKDHARTAIQKLSEEIETLDVYGHLGWKNINKAWVFLHCGGGIADGSATQDINVELEGEKLNHYQFPEEGTSENLHQAIEATLSLTDLAPDKVIFSLLAATFRAPLGEACPIDFSLFIVGPTGCQKTELTAFGQSFYGSGFHGKNLPGNWNSTSNSLEKAAFVTKDCLFVIDDFAPGGTAYDADKMHREAGRLLRGQANHAGRGRMTAKGAQRPEYFPRGLVFVSGEDLPRGQSIRARTWILEMQKGDVNLNRLTEAQHASREGLFAQTMAAYLKWLAPQMDKLKKSLPTRREELRDRIRQSSFVHDRTPETIASLVIGWEMFLKFARESGSIAQSEHDALYSRGYESMLEVGEAQADHQRGEEHSLRFIDLISAAFVSGHAHLVGMRNREKPCDPPTQWGWVNRWKHGTVDPDHQYDPKGDQIGWLKGDDIYLQPDAAFRVAQKLAGDQGTKLPISQTILWKRLKEKGYIATCEESRNTARVTIDGSRRPVLHLKASVFRDQAAVENELETGASKTQDKRTEWLQWDLDALLEEGKKWEQWEQENPELAAMKRECENPALVTIHLN